MLALQIATRKEAEDSLEGLAELLSDSVRGGASVGFLSSSPKQEIEAYWKAIIAEISPNARILMINNLKFEKNFN